MRKTFASIMIFTFIAFSGIYCKDEAKLGDEKGQILCAVMGGKIDKKAYIDYKGKRVYFCCPSCKDKFNKEPEKYMKKLEGVKLDDAAGKGMSKGHEGHDHE